MSLKPPSFAIGVVVALFVAVALALGGTLG